MINKRQKLIEKLNDDAMSFRKALSSESDRGCALFSAAHLDRALSDLLYVSMIYEPKKIEKDLFDFNAPLHTFSSRIRMAYYLGKISKATRRDLDLFRDIRNKFAHHPNVISFDDESIANKCRELSFTYRKKSDRPRLHFLGAVFGVLSRVHGATYNTQAPEKMPDDVPSEEEKAKHREIFVSDI